jgi:hypothetical protein
MCDAGNASYPSPILKLLDCCTQTWEIPIVQTVKADDKQRVRIPDIKPGQVFVYRANPDGTFLLSPVKAIERKTSILDGLTPMTDAQAKKAYGPNAEFDELEHHCAQLPTRPPDSD